ncbi:MAG TPA: cytochrome P450 [Tepidisphaeraceae bacterium]|nr:cytochrome P450 [Tepidisphaeraceae bacterium]
MRKAITTALEEAGRAGAEEASVEHLLLAIARDPQCAAVFMFEQAGIAPAKLIEQLPTNGDGAPRPERATRFSSAALHVLDVAVAEADRRDDRHVGTEHVALALARVNANPSAALLKELGFTHERGDAALKSWHRRGMPRQRTKFAAAVFATPILRTIAQPVERLAHYGAMGWHVYVGKSLGHPKFVTDPYPLYRKLRETEPVRKDPIAPVWVITRYAETMTMLRDPRFRKDPFAAERLPPVAREQLAVSDAAAGRASAEMVSMLFLDPPEHTRIRTIFTKAFTPRRLEAMRTRIQQITDKRLQRAEAASADGTIDLIRDLAYPLPVTVIAEMLGFPPEDYERIKKWSDEMAEALTLNPSADAQALAYRARQEIKQYFNSIAARLKEHPGDNLISALLTGEAYGERGERLNPDELFANCILLLAAGHETTTNLIGNGLLALLRHPEQLRDLRENTDALIGSAVDELLRYDPPVQWTSRVTGETITLGGKEIERGQILLASVGAANRDPAVFLDPDRLDLRRKDNRHLSFGAGGHFCLGAALARMEAETAIATLITRYPKLQLATNKLRWRKGLTFRGVHELPLRIR